MRSKDSGEHWIQMYFHLARVKVFILRAGLKKPYFETEAILFHQILELCSVPSSPFEVREV